MPRRHRPGADRSAAGRSGLRNRRRSGRGTYSRQKKGRVADSYGTWKNGERQSSESIARYYDTPAPRPPGVQYLLIQVSA